MFYLENEKKATMNYNGPTLMGTVGCSPSISSLLFLSQQRPVLFRWPLPHPFYTQSSGVGGADLSPALGWILISLSQSVHGILGSVTALLDVSVLITLREGPCIEQLGRGFSPSPGAHGQSVTPLVFSSHCVTIWGKLPEKEPNPKDGQAERWGETVSPVMFLSHRIKEP